MGFAAPARALCHCTYYMIISSSWRCNTLSEITSFDKHFAVAGRAQITAPDAAAAAAVAAVAVTMHLNYYC